MKRNAIAGVVVSALGLLAGSEAHAAAFALYEQGVSGLGNAYAGAAAVAEDATTVWWNPAGMARLGSGKHFAIAGTSISPSTKFSNGTSSPAALQTAGGDGGDAGKDAIVPSLEGQNTTSVDGDAWGFNVGGLFNVAPATRVGIHYRSSLDYKLDGNTSFSNVPAAFAGIPAAAAGTSNGNVKLDLKTPDNISFSVAHKLNDQWDLLGDLTWWHWSKIKQLPVVRTSGPANGTTLSTLALNFDDSWRAPIGANDMLNGPWTLNLGAAYDQTPVPNAESRSVRLPDNDRYWLSAGAAYQVSRNGKLDFGYTLVSAKNADINNDQRATGAGLVNGSYKAHVHVLGVQYQHSF